MGGRWEDGHSELFLVRVWAVEVGNDHNEVEWHGKVQRVTDGEVHHWRTWQELVDWLLAMLGKQRGRL